jgi:hypothetical protein
LELRETGDGEVEIVTVMVSYVPDEIDAMDESALCGLPGVRALGRVSSQRKHVATAVLLCILNNRKIMISIP